MLEEIQNMQKAGHHYTRGFLINFVAFAVIYKLFGFEWFLVVAVADLTRDIGIIMLNGFKESQ